MKIGQLQLRRFRNIQEQSLALQPGLNIFQGPNGQGKTNLVEAVYLLSHGKSFRTNDNSALVLHGEKVGTFLQAEILKKGLKNNLQFRIQSGKKQAKVNDKTVSGAFLRKTFPSVLFSPESLLIVKQSPLYRRNLIDDLAMSVQSGFAQVYEDCSRLLKQKNALLKQIRSGSMDKSEGHRVFHNVTDLFFTKGARLTTYRLEVIKKIGPLLTQEFSRIMGDSMVELSIDYLMSSASALDCSEAQIINAMYKRWEDLAPQEVLLGTALVGPHKHDVQFHFNGQQARLFCSQGQQRAIILAFKMAHIGLHWAAHAMYPILLLDDVLSELDQFKQTRFLESLMETESQILMTATDASLIPKRAQSTVFNVALGTFSKTVEQHSGGPRV